METFSMKKVSMVFTFLNMLAISTMLNLSDFNYFCALIDGIDGPEGSVVNLSA